MLPPWRHGRIRTGLVVLLMVGAAAFAAVASAAPASTSTATTTSLIHATAASSTNWAGYAATGPTGSVSDVRGSWVEPKVHGTCPTTRNLYSSFWVGIDGFTSNSVEQTGTDADCQGGTAVYYAWYEFYPNPSYLISTVPIHSGDVIFAEVKWNGTSKKFTLTLKDVTTAKSFSKTGTVSGAKRNSAEWIAEAPASTSILPLANFGTATFGKDTTKVNGTCRSTISGTTTLLGKSSSLYAITMINNAGTKTKAAVSSVSTDQTSFSVTWKSSGP
jgi:hypothetical protein